MNTAVQLDKSVERGVASSKPAYLSIIVVACLMAFLGLFWAARSSREWIVKRVDPYRVTRIHTTDSTMNLVHGNHSYIVRCAEHCTDFKAGGLYPMNDTGPALQYSHAGQTISLPIIEEETTFDVTGGHG